ncbi:hypothetical protein RJ44_02040 [Alteromonas macleodii]|uniref:tyrosine-type recombinase/integrase n=1 Tax=Alteromonas macleodii TaxID=28108 RepID=UPI00057D01B9|nr:site-specific integrase [Alteromonas macleodii]KHT61027.1 hypothetical protein RJ44_02040 [Alteromonas macleodii]
MLTDKLIKSLKPKSTPFYSRDTTGRRGTGTLVLQTLPSGTKTFHFQYYKDGKAQYLRIGRLTTHTLSEARAKASDYSRMLMDGTDPKEFVEQEKMKAAEESLKKEQISAQGTFKELIYDYTEDMKVKGKRTFDTVRNAMEKEFESLLDKAASEVSTEEIALVLSRMIKRGAAVQSNRVRSYAMTAFNFAIKHDYDPMYLGRKKKYLVKTNPVLNIPRQASAEVVRERTLSSDEVKGLLTALEGKGFSSDLATLIKLMFFLGGQRTFEIITLEWKDVDFSKSVIEISSQRSKNKKAHVIPMTSTVSEVLLNHRKLGDSNGFVFPNRNTPSEHMPTTSVAQCLRRYCGRADVERFQPKDIRRTVKTIMGELGVSKLTRDRLQNHALQDVSAKHYDRYDYIKEKREALERWDTYLSNLVIKKR